MTNDYIRDGVGVTDPVLADSGATYTPGISERPGGVTSYLHSGLKNADAQSGSSQTISASRKYDAWGNTRSSTGTWQGPFGHAGGFGYQSGDRSGLQLLGHRYYDPETGRFLSTDPIKDGMNWQVYGGGLANPLTCADPTGLLHIVITIDANGNGRANIYAEEGDILPVYLNGVLVGFRPAMQGELVGSFDVSNHVPNPWQDSSVVGGNGPFPGGTWSITGIESGRGMGPNFIVFRDQGVAGQRHTWVHSGAGEDYQRGTLGCIRARESDLNWVCWLIRLNWGNGNDHRVTVNQNQRPSPRPRPLRTGQTIGGGGAALRPR